jgi:hypothetical protein
MSGEQQLIHVSYSLVGLRCAQVSMIVMYVFLLIV